MLSRDGEIEGMGEGSLRLADAVVWNFKRVVSTPLSAHPVPYSHSLRLRRVDSG